MVVLLVLVRFQYRIIFPLFGGVENTPKDNGKKTL